MGLLFFFTMIYKNISKIHAFIRKQEGYFKTTDIVNAVFHKKRKLSGADYRSLHRWIKQHPDVLQEGTDRWKTKEGVFRGAQFRILLTPFEWSQKALLPAQRVIPYLSSFQGHGDCSFVACNGNEIQKKHKKVPFEEVCFLFTLLPLDMWESESDNPDRSILDFTSNTIEVPLYDISSLLPDRVELGGSLIVRVISSNKAMFCLHYVSSEQTQQQLLEASQIDARLERQMQEVIVKQKYAMISPDLLFFRALATLDEELQATPGHPISDLVTNSKLFTSQRSSTGVVSIGSIEKAAVQDTCGVKPEEEPYNGVFESLDDIFSEFELSLSREELEALAFGIVLLKWDKRELICRLVPEKVLTLLYSQEIDAILEEVKQLLTSTRRKLARQDWSEEKKNVICIVTEFYFENIETLRKFDIKNVPFEEIPEEAVIDNAEITGLLMSMLWLLVEDKGSVVSLEINQLLTMAKSSNEALKEIVAEHQSSCLKEKAKAK